MQIWWFSKSVFVITCVSDMKTHKSYRYCHVNGHWRIIRPSVFEVNSQTTLFHWWNLHCPRFSVRIFLFTRYVLNFSSVILHNVSCLAYLEVTEVYMARKWTLMYQEISLQNLAIICPSSDCKRCHWFDKQWLWSEYNIALLDNVSSTVKSVSVTVQL